MTREKLAPEVRALIERLMNYGPGASLSQPRLRRDFMLNQRDVAAAVKLGIRMGLLVEEPKIPRIWFEDGRRCLRYGGDARVKHYQVQSISAHQRIAIMKAITS